MANHSTILACKIPQTKEPGRLVSPWGHKGLDTPTISFHEHTIYLYIVISGLLCSFQLWIVKILLRTVLSGTYISASHFQT